MQTKPKSAALQAGTRRPPAFGWRSARRAMVPGMLLLAAAAFHPRAHAADTSGDGDAAAQVAAQVCSSCHGPGGISISPMFPRLAGQQEQYLAAQIRAFKAKTRADPEAHNYMWGMATLVSEPMIDALAHYYATQSPGPGIAGDAKRIVAGKHLFEEGVPQRGVVACASCHGAGAEGRAIFPRLAGQHAPYLVRQLEVIQKELRNSPIMHGIIKDLKPEEMRSVAEYLQA